MQELDDKQKTKIKDTIKKLISISSQNSISPNMIDVDIKSYRYDSDLLFVNATITIQNNRLGETEFVFSKDLKYITFGVIDISKILDEETSLKDYNQENKIIKDINLNDIPYKGNPNAKIKLVEFSDFECPFCKRFYTSTFKQLKDEWIDQGKLVMYYMHFPLEQIHPKAEPSARASYCAYKQGKFWEYHDLLFEKLNAISNDLNGYKSLAQELGLDLDKFSECYNSDEAKRRVQYEAGIGFEIGVRGTPSFLVIVDKSLDKNKVREAAMLVNGQVFESENNYIIFFSGAYPYSQFNAMLSKLS